MRPWNPAEGRDTSPVGLRHSIAQNRVPPSSGGGHPLIELMLARHEAGSERGARTDDAVIALAIEGGGSCGVISAGMCLVLEQTGLIDAVDMIYGTSSGALNGSFTASGQAALGTTNYLDVANTQFANPLRVLTGRAVIDFDFLFDELIGTRKPYDANGLAAGPAFHALCVDLDSSTLQILDDFADTHELAAAVRASCSLPLLADAQAAFRGRTVADGSLIQSIPYSAAQGGGATHVLVLRSHTAAHRQVQYPRALLELARRVAHPSVARLIRERPDLYNAEAEHLGSIGSGDPHLFQIAPSDAMPRVNPLEISGNAIRVGLASGAAAAAAALGLPPIEVLWQPELYVTA